MTKPRQKPKSSFIDSFILIPLVQIGIFTMNAIKKLNQGKTDTQLFGSVSDTENGM